VQIEPTTLIIQIVNFILIVLVLRWLLFDRVLKMMNDRRDRIASQMEEAEQKSRQAEAATEEYSRRRREIYEERKEILGEARQEAERQKRDMLDEAREEVEQTRGRWQEAMEQEREAFMDDLRRRIGEEFMSVTRRALGDLANADLEQQMVKAFIERMESLNEEERAIFSESARQLDTVVVYSTFELAPEMQEQITEVLRDTVRGDVHVSFQIDHELICGISIRTNVYEISWSLSNYLQSLDVRMFEAVSEEGEA
jgi:F-type H+-transporting ATPase subunit b